jgi:hypothetical protein
MGEAVLLALAAGWFCAASFCNSTLMVRLLPIYTRSGLILEALEPQWLCQTTGIRNVNGLALDRSMQFFLYSTLIMKNWYFRTILFPLLSCLLSALALSLDKPDSVTVVPAPDFADYWPYGLLFGGQYQSLWLTPLRLEQFNLATFSGGLAVDYARDNHESRVLVMHSPKGDTLNFMPLREHLIVDQVDPRDKRLLPVHPSAALVVDELCVAVRLPRLHPRLVWVPDDSLLGAYQASFGGVPGLLFTLPADSGSSDTRLVDTPELLRALATDSRNLVDGRLYLTCRLMDLLTGDWERSPSKWQWLRAPSGGQNIYKPIPLLHRQSFLMLGFVPSLVHNAITPGFVNYREEMGSVRRFVRTAAALDSRALASVDHRTWDSVTTAFVAALSDSVIDAAVRKLPPEHFSLVGEQIARALRLRRNIFAAISEEFYRVLAEYIELYLSDAGEYVSIQRRDNGTVDIAAWQRDNRPTLVFHRTFLIEETKEIRLYCLGGNDTVIVIGRTEKGPVLRVLGGPGNDMLRDEAIAPSPSSSKTTTFFYDHEGANDLRGGSGTVIDRSPAPEFVPRGRFF